MTSSITTSPASDWAPSRPPGAVARFVRGNPADPRWARPALLGLLAATALLYVWGLGASGWANSFYSAAVQAGATSWKAFFFGASDAGNSITVDKTPMALWPMALAARVFGVNAWSILVPQALMGVATGGVVYATVRRGLSGLSRRTATGAALLAGGVLALTPVAVLMFRFNNPDALLVLLLTLGAYGMVRAQQTANTRWLVFAASMVGFGFLAKMLQAFLVVPGFALVYLLTAPTSLRRRLWQLLVAGAALVVSAGWWVAIVALVPASARPYIGGSQHNSVLELALGYNGFGRLNGDETGGLGNLNREAGWLRMFGYDAGAQISWLLPAALILLAAAFWVTRRATRTDSVRAAVAVWGGWLLATGLVFSLMRGIFHAYYTVALAPAIAAIVGMGAALLWERRREPGAAALLAAAVAATAVWTYILLGRAADWNPWLRPVVLIGGLGTAAALLAAGRMTRRVLATAGAVAVTVSLAGPAAYALNTASTPHMGAIPSAGPSSGSGGPGGPGGPGGNPGQRPRFGGQFPGGPFGQFRGGFPGGAPGGFPGRQGGGGGGLLNGSTSNAELTALLKQNASAYRWVAAAVGSNNASGYQLASGRPVMPIGGFNGTDPSPTLAQFEAYVAAGKVHYFIAGGMGGGMRGGPGGGGGSSQEIVSWVGENFTARTVGGVTVYDLTQ
ncbi:MAG TPA: glycosyltransferase family 39 protein [Streptosporangiaceae bacterium]|jgi:4-amino-4-deoxy-L-arabinose transferase-like glycosyltransferase